MDDKEKQEVAKPNNGLIDSHTQVMTDIWERYSVIQLTLKLKDKDEDEYDLKNQIDKQSKKSRDLFLSLGANDPLKTMLVAQMVAVHDLQQDAYLRAKGSHTPQAIQYEINAAVKLSNVFIQQVAILQKLQGKDQQKVTVEHVHIHDGAQAIVGNVETGGVKGGGREC